MKEYRDSIAELSALTEALVLEHRAEEERYRSILEGQPVARRREEGLSWSPVKVVRAGFTVGGRPTLELVADAGQLGAFRTGSAVQLTSDDAKGEKVTQRGIVRSARGLEAEVVLDGTELPDQVVHRTWVLDARFDERSFQEMARALSEVLNAGRDGKASRLATLREVLLGYARPEPSEPEPYTHPDLNPSQCAAVAHALTASEVTTVHGPPGTGKTTTLVQLVKALVRRGEKVLCSAPSNAAVDLMVERLGAAGLKVVRIGHPMRIDPAVVDRSLERLVEADPDHKQVKAYRKQAEEAAREAEKKFRTFGADQRAARREAYAEARALRKEADRLESHGRERVELLVHLHGADLGGECRPGARREQDRCHQRAELPEHRDAEEVGHEDLRAEALPRNDRREGQDQADQEPDEHHDGDGADAGPLGDEHRLAEAEHARPGEGTEQRDDELADEDDQRTRFLQWLLADLCHQSPVRALPGIEGLGRHGQPKCAVHRSVILQTEQAAHVGHQAPFSLKDGQ